MEEEKKEATIKLPKLNLWMLISTVLVICLVGVLWFNPLCPSNASSATGLAVLSEDDAGNKAIDYLNNNIVQQGTKASLVSVQEKNGIYEVMTSYKGNDIPIYITKDGSLLFLNRPLNTSEEIKRETREESQQALTCGDVPKRDKPIVELFTFSYCPYGTQYEKGLLPVVELLGNKADIKVIFIGAMHGLHEEIESKRQLCIREEQPNKFWDYLKCFAYSEGMKDCSSKFYTEFRDECRNEFEGNQAKIIECMETKMAECIEPYIDECFDKANIDKSKINDCMENRADDYYKSDNQIARNYDISSSPTVRVNDIIITGRGSELAGRSPDAIKDAICCGFMEKPSKCEQNLNMEVPSPGFGGGVGSSSGGKC